MDGYLISGGRFSGQPTALARTIPKYTPRAENTVRTNRLLFGVPTALRGQLHAVTRLFLPSSLSFVAYNMHDFVAIVGCVIG
eukprot:scaffold3382_cov121-Skeletonema_dohrnii-CCMP3373.AAC.10